PWPSDLRLENGSPRFTGYYNPRNISVIDQYIETMKGLLDGFSPAAAGYVRFTAAIDPSTLPASPKAGLGPSASVQLIDVAPAPPEPGKRQLISLEWHENEAVYYRSDTLAFMPTIGFPLRPRTRYAFVVTDALKAADGTLIGPSVTLKAVLGLSSSS